MDRVPVFYATTEGHTRRVARAIASTLREQGFDSEALDVAAQSESPDWLHIKGAVVGASIHGGPHQRAVETFVAREGKHLASRPAAFFSVSLSAASRDPEKVAAARAIATNFVQHAGWFPQRLTCFPGKLAYSQYGFFKRWIMRRIAKAEGQPTDTRRDYDYTDWSAVRDFALVIASDLREAARGRTHPDSTSPWAIQPRGDYSAPPEKVPASAGRSH
jgi:menaquinone-dependent protoporphyrinogen oxidase